MLGRRRDFPAPSAAQGLQHPAGSTTGKRSGFKVLLSCLNVADERSILESIGCRSIPAANHLRKSLLRVLSSRFCVRF